MSNLPRITIDTSIIDYCINQDETLRNAITKITENEHGIVFCIDESGEIQGVLSDGDVRRWMVLKDSVSLNESIFSAMNTSFKAKRNNKINDLPSLLNDKSLRAIPLLDRQNRVTGIATIASENFTIASHQISESSPVFTIAEIGNNHQGSLDLAKELIRKSKSAGASCAKFQLRDLSSLYSLDSEGEKNVEDLGTEYTLDLLNRFQLNDDDMFKAFDYCHQIGITPLCTPWDLKSVEKLEKYGIEAYKLASADFTNTDLINAVSQTRKPMICSTGMCNDDEIISSISYLKKSYSNYALLHCNSTYPAPFKDVNLRYINKLKTLGDCNVGYSSHERGYSAVLAAIGMGARIIEKHITLNKSWEGIDHRVSLLPEEFKQMVDEITNANDALGTGNFRNVSQGEVINRENLGKSIFVNRNVEKGDIFTSEVLVIKSPGKGLSPKYKEELIGSEAQRDFKKGEMLETSDLLAEKSKARVFNFSRPFGLPVRYHDIYSLSIQSNPKFLEFHLSYKDLDRNIEDFIDNDKLKDIASDFVIHCPELFDGEHLLDLCSEDKIYREKSINNLNRTIMVTNSLKKYFPEANTPVIVVNVGGFSQDKHLTEKDRLKKYELFEDSLMKIDTDGVNICPQTMPPFPWHFGGQRYHNLFVFPEEIALYCEKFGLNICLDLSHSKLTCNYFKLDFNDFLSRVGPYISHMHIADSDGFDGEGLQIGAGDINFKETCQVLNQVASNASFIPEVWQGHKNNGAGFWEALNSLEEYFNDK